MNALAPEVYFRLVTYWGTVVYFDQKANGLRHGRFGQVPDNVVGLIKNGALVLNYTIDAAGTAQAGAQRTESFTLAQDRADLMFGRDGVFASADANGLITISRPAADEWERFLPVPVKISDVDLPDETAMPDSRPHTRKSSRPIRLFWWRPTKHVNLGDEVNPRIVAAVSGREVKLSPASTADMLAVGSVLRVNPQFARQSPTYVWGSGLMEDLNIATSQYIFSAVRGPLTRERVSRSTEIPLGDPGLLASCIWKPASAKQYSWGIIPHFSQHKGRFKLMHDNTPRSVLIDVTNPDIDETVRLISECDFIASTSLHGLIFADAFGIPNIWLKAPALHAGGNFKYYDYFASVGKTDCRRIMLCSNEGLQSLEPFIPSAAYQANIADMQKGLIKCFPHIL